ncbi:ABC transporter ATP-binding protein [Lactobacillus iners]|uniref:ABC transporter, ATP-binding protein n=2 Tax=Lactobacillus iners TaxID=147802 RepID=E1NV17_9LACO|nr:ABC transporter ATP-binding protein [Lactobacillus iners]EFO65878.1 ABC transporter, ATP-binding protein [Lactobacillus iners LactinV 11V1-d]EFO70044.1 ABC transporter, ATP-binding protein [Lactobacillus iners LactinV 01V1-a]EFQ48459.1 ABC transporter, ATP-binding protein [Lactobacillus iners LEAF 2052A-d]EGC79435.1 ABC transporter, ATP-binding protein [Lactobacillus iners UPII 143-D]EGC80396.1 ABC transporter, ATP-binding protein [Lactobacillus iners UPII 60-B]
MNNVFEISNITKSFKNKQILKGVDLIVNRGDIIGLLGLNGEGKSTLIKIILGILSQDYGEVKRNFDIKSDVGVMLQEISMPEKMKVYEWLDMVKCFSTNSKSVESVLDSVNLRTVRNKYCDSLSGGQQRRVQFATAIINNPKVLILDEPTVGMDVVSKKAFWETLNTFSFSKDLTIILISHDMEEVAEFCNRVLILSKGLLVSDSKMTDIQDRIEKNSSYSIDKSQITQEQLEVVTKFSFEETDSEIKFTYQMIDEVVSVGKIPISIIKKNQSNLRQYFMEVLENEPSE